MNINNTVSFLQSRNNEFDISNDNYTIDYNTDIQWGLWLTNEEYQEKEKEINNIKIENELYKIYAWCDVSWYKYWVKQQEENNYIVVSVILKKDLTKKQLIELDEKVYWVIEWLR